MLCEKKVRKNSDNGKIEGFTHSFMNYALNMIALPNGPLPTESQKDYAVRRDRELMIGTVDFYVFFPPKIPQFFYLAFDSKISPTNCDVSGRGPAIE
jgi:hypothetical protein